MPRQYPALRTFLLRASLTELQVCRAIEPYACIAIGFLSVCLSVRVLQDGIY